MERWEEISRIGNRKTHLIPRTWTMDKYPGAPTLSAKSSVTLIDQVGPGVITNLHVSDYWGGDDGALILRIWYDGDKEPTIQMPLMDFLGDVESATGHYQTMYFSHVRESHNFHLPIPFRKHIRIEIDNPTENNFFGYSEIQWDEVDTIPTNCAYLHVSYQKGTFFFPHQDLVLCEISTPGSIVAHWLQLEADHESCADGQGICEANHEIYLDGDAEPTLECLGVEDFYGHSWGFLGIESDFYTAIIRYEKLPQGGTRAAMIRVRDTDKITFKSSCRIRLTYQYDLGEKKAPALQPFIHGFRLDTPYRSCIYYYANPSA
jgi:hypothetical protein